MTKEDKEDKALRGKRMDRYDAHTNQYGHFSAKKTRQSARRSPILDEILRSGQRLVSNYEERIGFPPETEKLTESPTENFTSESLQPETDEKLTNFIKSLPKVNNEVGKLREELTKLTRDHDDYMKVYMRLKRAEEKAAR